MKRFNLLNFAMMVLLIFVGSIISKADEGCLKRETGYKYFVPSGNYICVLDNSSRDCVALVDRCKYPKQ